MTIMHDEREVLRCPCCDGGDTVVVYRLDSIPVQSCILLDTAEEARRFPRHALQLRFCRDCGFIYNSVFDERLVDYSSATEESQHFSGTFNSFAKTLISEVIDEYPLAGKTVVEIGCGKGDFLRELCGRADCAGLGIDPGFIHERQALSDAQNVSFRREYFDPTTVDTPADLVICRHTLEHIDAVGKFVRDVRRMIGDRADVGVFFETPDMRRVLEEGAYWDIYFEHCSYFTSGSHARLFRKAGFDVTSLYRAFDDQYIIQYASPTDENTSPRLDSENDLEAVRALAETFPTRIAESQERWRDFITTRANAGKRVAIWGGGSKCVAFLTSIGIGDEVKQVVDINPNKQGKFLPGTGHQVVAPTALRSEPPDTVIVMNPIYVDEITADLSELGVAPELVAV